MELGSLNLREEEKRFSMYENKIMKRMLMLGLTLELPRRWINICRAV
jgi:hypothetical protein